MHLVQFPNGFECVCLAWIWAYVRVACWIVHFSIIPTNKIIGQIVWAVDHVHQLVMNQLQNYSASSFEEQMSGGQILNRESNKMDKKMHLHSHIRRFPARCIESTNIVFWLLWQIEFSWNTCENMLNNFRFASFFVGFSVHNSRFAIKWKTAAIRAFSTTLGAVCLFNTAV